MQAKKKQSGALAGLGGRVTRARHRANLTQEALASQANLSMSTLSKIEAGHSTPTLPILLRIATVLGESPDALVGWQEPALSGEARKRAVLVEDVQTALASLPTKQLEALAALLKR